MKQVSKNMARGYEKGLTNRAASQMKRSDYANAKAKGVKPLEHMKAKLRKQDAAKGKPSKRK